MKDTKKMVKDAVRKTNKKENSNSGIAVRQGVLLALPHDFNEAVNSSARELDMFLASDRQTTSALKSRITAHHKASLPHIMDLPGKLPVDVKLFHWPDFLYIPKNANDRDYWISPAPADHRYSMSWTSPTSDNNKASILDGSMSSYAQLDNANAAQSQSSESGIGIFFKPSISLGVIDLQPHINCGVTLRTYMEYDGFLTAGSVEVKAQLLLAVWHQIPGGFDLLNFKTIDIGTTGKRDPSHGQEYITFQKSFTGTPLSAPFVVQAGRTYLLGVVCRVSVLSSLTANTVGNPVPAISNKELRVWGSIASTLKQIDVLTKQVYLP